MKKLFHEAPNSIFKQVQSITDGDYGLVHLLEENEQYRELFFEAKAAGREIILDNSIFELGTAFDADKFAGWVEKLRPDWYIVPDVLEDCQGTIDNLNKWLVDYKDLPGKKIGVIQGKTLDELVECYEAVEPNVDMVAISFDYSLYEFFFPYFESLMTPTKWHSWMEGRSMVLEIMDLQMGVINKNKPHHLLGCSLPQEFVHYKNIDWIYSIDTSNPVVHGLKNIKYDPEIGLAMKESTKLFTLIESEVDLFQLESIIHNIRVFRTFTE